MAIGIGRLNLDLDEIKDVVVSDIVHDVGLDVYVRTVQFFVDPVETENRRPVVEVRVSGAVAADVKFVTPQLEF